MRPVKKPSIGEQIRFSDSQGRLVEHVVTENYNSYSNAKTPLVGALGAYCSYCESPKEISDLAVEHITAKSKGGSATEWNNFLLCCHVCNSIKGNADTNMACHWPHINNTFLSFVYDHTGRVKVNPALSAGEQKKANNLLKLFHLGRYPNSSDIPTAKDYRWRRRFETWNKASRCKKLFLNGNITLDDVIDAAKINGHWSVWFTVFKGLDVVLNRLLTDFPGTCKKCFDPGNHYTPMERNPQM